MGGPTAYLRPHCAHAAALRTCGPAAYCGPAPNNLASLGRSEPQALFLLKNDASFLEISVIVKHVRYLTSYWTILATI